jgi:branched-chain amino acid transport system substrate-binding protein
MISQWQILEQGIIGAKSLDDKAIAQFLKKSGATTIYGKLRFDGPFNHGDPAQMVKQVQNKKWVVVWPKEFAPPGVSLIAP